MPRSEDGLKSWAKADHNQEPWMAWIEGQGGSNTQGVVRAKAGQNPGSRWLWSGGSRQGAIEDQGEQGPLRNEKVGVVWYAGVRLSLYQSTLVVWWVKCWMADSDSHIPTTCLVEPVPRCLWKCDVMLSWALIGTQKGDVLLEVLNSIYQAVTLLVEMTLRLSTEGSLYHGLMSYLCDGGLPGTWRQARCCSIYKSKFEDEFTAGGGANIVDPYPPIFILTDGMALPWRRSDGGQVPGSYVQGPRGQPLSLADQQCSAVAGICHRQFFFV